MKMLNKFVLLALLQGVVLTAFAEQSERITDSLQRLSQAVKRTSRGESGTLNPLGPDSDQQAGNTQDLTPLARALAQQPDAAEPTVAQRKPVKPSSTQKVSLADEAYGNMVNTTPQLSLSPDQIRRLHKLFDHNQRAAAEHPEAPPKPTSKSIMVDLAPGASPPIIRLSAGFVSSLVFVDGTGAPWPIVAWDLGDPRSYNIQWDKKGNTLMIQAITRYKTGNLAVVLKNMHTPIVLTLLPGQKAVDYRVDLRMPGLGPNASTTETSLPASENTVLLNVLNGAPPQGSRKLGVSGGQGEAWLFGDQIYLRTRLTAISPGWLATMSSADGLHAYELQQTPIVLASDHGKLVKLVIEGL